MQIHYFVKNASLIFVIFLLVSFSQAPAQKKTTA